MPATEYPLEKFAVDMRHLAMMERERLISIITDALDVIAAFERHALEDGMSAPNAVAALAAVRDVLERAE